MERYCRNLSSITYEENLILQKSRVCVVGCGGLGGYVIEMLARLGVLQITAVDGDVFEESNLNRQLFSDEEALGKSKVYAAAERIQKVNSQVQVAPIAEYVYEDNAAEILEGHDLVIDALDQIGSRFVIQSACRELGIPLVHGAIAGWYGQVMSIFPEDEVLEKVYSQHLSRGMEQNLGNPAFTPALVASMEVSEAVKILIGRGELLRGRLLFLDLLHHDYVVIEL